MADTMSEWRRVPGKARNYVNSRTGEVISRRQYDKLEGTLSKQGFKSYEQKAKVAKRNEGIEQLAKPARGRTKLKEKEPEIRRTALAARVEQEQHKKLSKLEQREIKRKARTPKSISLKNFKKGALGRTFRVDLDPGALADFISAAASYKGAFGYLLGIEFIDTRSGKVGASALTHLRAFNKPFTNSDWDTYEEWILEHLYAEATFAYVYVSLKIEVARKHGRKD